MHQSSHLGRQLVSKLVNDLFCIHVSRLGHKLLLDMVKSMGLLELHCFFDQKVTMLAINGRCFLMDVGPNNSHSMLVVFMTFHMIVHMIRTEMATSCQRLLREA